MWLYHLTHFLLPVVEVEFESDLFEVEEGNTVNIRLNITQLVDPINTPVEITVIAQNGTPPLDASEKIN